MKQLCEREKGKIPKFIQKCVVAIEKKGKIQVHCQEIYFIFVKCSPIFILVWKDKTLFLHETYIWILILNFEFLNFWIWILKRNLEFLFTGLDHDGIYRISGNLAQIQKLRCQVDQGKGDHSVSYSTSYSASYSVNAIPQLDEGTSLIFVCSCYAFLMQYVNSMIYYTILYYL